MARNEEMVERIEQTPVAYPIRFVVAGDSGAFADPTADAVFAQLVGQVDELDPAPLFFANLGDFAGPGTRERHEHYLGLVERLSVPNICAIGNHDLDDEAGWDEFARVHGPVNFEFAHGHTRFVVLHAAPGERGEIVIAEGAEAVREEDLAFLEAALKAAPEEHRVVLMHMPPHLDGRYAPHADWGFEPREAEFLRLVRDNGVGLVCCAHGLAFDAVERDGIWFVMSGGGGTGLCSHFNGVCTEGEGRPEDRGALFHFVELSIAEAGDVSGRVVQAFAGTSARLSFGG